MLALVMMLQFPLVVANHENGNPECDLDNVDTSPRFQDGCYHQGVWYSPDTAEYDVIIVPPASPYALRDIELVEESVDMWEDGIKRMGASWLREGLHINDYTLGLEQVPVDALQDPEVIVLLTTEFHAVAVGGLFGVAVQNPSGACADIVQAMQEGRWSDIPGFHQHPGSSFGSYTTGNDCGGTLGTQRQCYVVNTNFPFAPAIVSDNDRRRTMFDLISHEVGHCLTLGHVGDADTESTDDSDAYPEHDILSYEGDGHVERDASGTPITHCPSNLNVRTIERAFGYLFDQPGASRAVAPSASAYTHMHPDDWTTDEECEPADADWADPSYVAERGVLGEDEDSDVGGSTTPVVTIDDPSDGSTVPAEVTAVSGKVEHQDADSLRAAIDAPDQANAATSVSIVGSATGGDSESGYTCAWSDDSGASTYGDASACDTTVSFDATGDFTITLTVDDGASTDDATHQILIRTAGLPQPSGEVFGNVFAYNEGGLGASNVVAVATAEAGDPVPKYPAGSTVTISARNVEGLGTPCSADAAGLEIYDADGNRVFATSANVVQDRDAVTGAPTECRIPAGTVEIPVEWEGRYYLAPWADAGGIEYVDDRSLDDPTDLKPIDVLGAPASAPASASLLELAFNAGGDTTTLYFEGTGDEGSVDSVLDDHPRLSASAPPGFLQTFTDNPALDGNWPGLPYDPSFVHEGGLGLDGEDVTVTFFASPFGLRGTQLDGNMKFDVSLWVDDGDGTWDSLADADFDTNDDVVGVERAEGPAPLAGGWSELSVTFEDVSPADPDGMMAVMFRPAFLDDVPYQIIYGGDEWASRVEITSSGDPLSVDAGGPYAGDVDEAIPVAATISGGDGSATCTWSGGDFADPSACSTTVTFATTGDHTITVDAADSTGSASDTATVTVTDTPAGERVEILVDGTLHDTEPVDTSGSTSDTWSGSVDLTGMSGEHTITAEWYAADGTLLDADSITVTVDGGNQAPTADAGADQEADEGDNVGLDGTGSSDADGSISSYAWEQTAGPDAPLSDPTSATPSFTAPEVDADTTLTFELTVTDDEGATDSDSTDVVVRHVSDPTVTVTSPAVDGETVDTFPVTFEGGFDRDDGGAAMQANAVIGTPDVALTADAQPGVPGGQEWEVPDSFGAFADLASTWPGYMGAAPYEGTFVVALEGARTSDMPEAWDGIPIDYREDVEPERMIRDATPQEMALQGSAEPLPGVDVRQNSPDGPLPPGSPFPDGIGPGNWLRMGSSICSAGHVFFDQDTDKYYLSTAGHCLIPGEIGSARSGYNNDGAVVPSVSTCYVGCVMNVPIQIHGGGLTTWSAGQGYHPVAFAHSQGVGTDFALIEIPEQFEEHIRPWMPQWGGPTRDDSRTSGGDIITHFGHGTYCCVVVGAATRAPVDQGRLGVSAGSNGNAFFFLGQITGGDSGSGSGTGEWRQDKQVLGQGAVGVNTHLAVRFGDLVGIDAGTHYQRGLQMLRAYDAELGDNMCLVGEDMQLIGCDGGGEDSDVEITSPADGQTFDKETDSPVITGTAAFSNNGGAPQETYFLHRDGCGSDNDVLFMDQDVRPGGHDGDGCGSLAHPIGTIYDVFPELEDVIDSSRKNVYDADPVPSQEMVLDHERPLEVEIHENGFAGEQQTVLLDYEATLKVDGQVLATGRTLEPVQTSGPITMELEMDDAITSIPAGADMEFTFFVHTAAGPVFIGDSQEMPSQIRIPVLQTSTQEVQVAVDDASFGADSLLDVTGLEDWSAPWDLSDVAPGDHTIHVRTLEDGAVAATDSVSVTVNGPQEGYEVKLSLAGPDGDVFSDVPAGGDDPDTVSTGSWEHVWDPQDPAEGAYTLTATFSHNGEVLDTATRTFTVDLDRDDDGVQNDEDNCPDTANPDQSDVDGDGFGDACDPRDNRDSDGDGVENWEDQCEGYPDGYDHDGDGTPDGCDPDADDKDGDGIDTHADNCPGHANVDQEDMDGDGVGDACDPDRDGDGYTNKREEAQGSDPDDPESTP